MYSPQSNSLRTTNRKPLLTNKVSFIVSTFNRPDSLQRLIQSLENQTLKEWELLIMDESPDFYSKQHKTQRITPHHCDRYNDWGYSVKELGAKKATGEYLCFPADDAQYHPTFAEKLLALKTDFAYCDWNWTNHNRIVSAEPKEGQIDIGGFLVKRELFEGFADKGTCGDARFVESFVKNHSHSKVQETLYTKS